MRVTFFRQIACFVCKTSTIDIALNPAVAKAPRKRDGDSRQRGSKNDCVWTQIRNLGLRCYSRTIFENIGANMYNLVQICRWNCELVADRRSVESLSRCPPRRRVTRQTTRPDSNGTVPSESTKLMNGWDEENLNTVSWIGTNYEPMTLDWRLTCPDGWYRLVISAQFTLEMYIAARNAKKVTKTSYFIILGFKVVQGHRCRYHQIARQQCLVW